MTYWSQTNSPYVACLQCSKTDAWESNEAGERSIPPASTKLWRSIWACGHYITTSLHALMCTVLTFQGMPAMKRLWNNKSIAAALSPLYDFQGVFKRSNHEFAKNCFDLKWQSMTQIPRFKMTVTTAPTAKCPILGKREDDKGLVSGW